MAFRKQHSRDEHSDVDTGPLNDYPVHITHVLPDDLNTGQSQCDQNECTKAKSDTKQKQSVVVSVDKDKNLMGSRRINTSLESVLRKYIHEGDSIKPAVVINADSVAQWGEIVRVMKVARRLGATTSATVTGSE